MQAFVDVDIENVGGPSGTDPLQNMWVEDPKILARMIPWIIRMKFNSSQILFDVKMGIVEHLRTVLQVTLVMSPSKMADQFVNL